MCTSVRSLTCTPEALRGQALLHGQAGEDAEEAACDRGLLLGGPPWLLPLGPGQGPLEHFLLAEGLLHYGVKPVTVI